MSQYKPSIPFQHILVETHLVAVFSDSRGPGYFSRIQVNQVARGLINKKSNVTTVRNFVIMHMNAGRNNMTKEGKAQISRPEPPLRQVQC